MNDIKEIRELLEEAASIEAAERRVETALNLVISEPQTLITFLNNYAKWNREFAGGVAALTSLISDQNFQEKGFPPDLADRSTYVASYIFDAARDEYDDHINPQRDTHRSLAQATLLGMMEFFSAPESLFSQKMPDWLQALDANVLLGYTGSPLKGTLAAFKGLGYHLGSELLADREFSIIDSILCTQCPELVYFLKRKKITITGVDHRCYAWIGIHSGQGSAVEADHFDYGLKGVHKALQYLNDSDSREECLNQLVNGFKQFAFDHEVFFRNAAPWTRINP
jgi:hypothetical protein